MTRKARPCIIHRILSQMDLASRIYYCFAISQTAGNHFEFDMHQLAAKSLHSREVSTEDPGFKQLDPGASLSWSKDLPSVYFDALCLGRSYEIVWGGGQIPLWDWGTLAECSKSRRQLASKSPAIVLPSGPQQSLEVIDESDVGVCNAWSPPPLSPFTTDA